MRIEYLSYPFQEHMPVYGDPTARMEIQSLKCPTRGDSCSTYRISFENHWGTHVDGPAHFFHGSQEIADYAADYWQFKNPQVVKVELKVGELLQVRHLTKISKKADLLLFRSGWFKKRGKPDYSLRNPGVHAEVGTHLRKHYPRIRAIGFDWISLSSYLNREMGRLAHRTFLNPAKPGKPILIIEDINLKPADSALKEVRIAPWQIQGIDSTPCSVFGIWK